MNSVLNNVYLGLGSNLRNRKANIKKCLDFLKSEQGINLKKQSSFYETKPVGGPKQRDFINAVVLIQTSLTPRSLLKVLKDIEIKLGRKKSKILWGPRIIDIDILFFDQLIYKGRNLKIPHPRMHERLFVLEPFYEISPRFKHPILKKTISRLIKEIKERV